MEADVAFGSEKLSVSVLPYLDLEVEEVDPLHAQNLKPATE
jgi:hypothetical protein